MDELKNPLQLFKKADPSETASELKSDLKSSLDSSVGTRVTLQPRIQVEEILENSADFDGTCLCAGLDFQLTTLEDRVKLSYKVDYNYLIDNNEGYFFQQATLSYIFKNDLVRDISLDLSYFDGERAPTFERENLLTAGLGFQF